VARGLAIAAAQGVAGVPVALIILTLYILLAWLNFAPGSRLRALRTIIERVCGLAPVWWTVEGLGSGYLV
jgi:hypothetical protein